MAYMVAGYLIIWVASFAFIFSMVQRQRNLQREIDTLKNMVEDNQGAAEQVGALTSDRVGQSYHA
jgi:CcmD family protein